MQILSPTSWIIAIAVLVLVAVVLLRLRNSGRRVETLRPKARGPGSLNYACARCSAEVTHTRRTLAAWEKGSRRFFCNSCHKNWRDAQPAREQQDRQPASPSIESRAASRAAPQSGYSPTPRGLAPARSGCFTVILILVLMPAGTVVIVLSAYA